MEGKLYIEREALTVYHHPFLTSCCRFVTAAGFKVCNNPQKPWVKKTLNKLRRKK